MKSVAQFVIVLGVGAPALAETIHLKDGSVVKGSIQESASSYVTAKTPYGLQKYPKEEIVRIEFEDAKPANAGGSAPAIPPAGSPAPSQLVPVQGIETIGKAMLYESSKKSVGVMLALQLPLGAGLIYSENYAAGIPLMLLENALIIASPMFSDDPGLMVGYALAGIGLRSLDTFLSIWSVNVYNQRQRVRLGVESAAESRAKTPGGAFVRSFVFPGWGQHYNGQHTFGYVTQGAWLIAVGTAVAGIILYQESATQERYVWWRDYNGNPFYSYTTEYDEEYLALAAGSALAALGIHTVSMIAAPISAVNIRNREAARSAAPGLGLHAGVTPAGPGGALTYRF